MQRSITLSPLGTSPVDVQLIKHLREYVQVEASRVNVRTVSEMFPEGPCERVTNFLRHVERALSVPTRPQRRKFPSINDVARILANVVATTDWEPIHAETCPELDVRLQVRPDGSWDVNTGDAQYDTDHSGVWGAATLGGTENKSDLYAVAQQLINEAKDQATCVA